MSKKSKNRYRQQNRQVAVDNRPSPTQENGLFANDGYTNSMAFIGEASNLLNAGTYERHAITSNLELLTTLYRENWICKRIIDVPAEDMTREWYTLNTQLEGDKVKELQILEQKHDIKGELTNAIRWARLYGGSAALMVIAGQEDMLDEPLDMDMLVPGCFRGLIIIDRWMGLEPSMELEEDMDDVDFGYPKYYTLYLDDMKTNVMHVHHSRLLTFRGRDLPHMEEKDEDYWGASEMEHIYEELNKRNATSANIAQLVFQANIRTLKMGDFGEQLAMGTKNQKQAVLSGIQEQNRLLSNFGVQVLSAEDSYENHPYSFGGLSDIYQTFMSDMAGAAEMPATKLYGKSPDGMNATGDSDMQMYYDSIAQKQERSLRPALEKLLPVMAMSLWGVIPDDLEINFKSIMTASPADRASIGSQITNNVVTAFNAGIIGRKTALTELRENGKDVGVWQKITDEMIEEADDEIDNGEGMGGEDPMGGMGGDPAAGGDPMAAMMGAMGGGGGQPQEAQEGPQGQEQPKGDNPADEQQEKPEEAEKPKDGEDRESILQKVAALIEEVYGKKESRDEKPRKVIYSLDELANEVIAEMDGGPGSGNFGHKGRPGKRGGSSREGGSSGSENSSSGSYGSSSMSAETSSIASGVKSRMKKVTHAKFAQEIAKVREQVIPEKRWRVDAHDKARYDEEGATCFTSKSGDACVSVTEGHDIISVCAIEGGSVKGKQLMAWAVANGGDRLDSFDGNIGFYIKCGFEPVSGCTFSKEFAPDGWDENRDYEEPIVFMTYTGRSVAEIEADFGAKAQDWMQKVPFFDGKDGYDNAWAERDRRMKK